MVDLHYARGLGRNRLGTPPLGCKHWPGMSKTTGMWIHRSKSPLHIASAASFWFCSKYPISHKSATNMFFWLVKMIYLITDILRLKLDNFNGYNKPWNSNIKCKHIDSQRNKKKYQRNIIWKLYWKKNYQLSSDNFFCFFSFSSLTYSYDFVFKYHFKKCSTFTQLHYTKLNSLSIDVVFSRFLYRHVNIRPVKPPTKCHQKKQVCRNKNNT